MLPLSRRLRPQMTSSRSGTCLPSLRAASFFAARAVSASATKTPAAGPRPLLFRYRYRSGVCWERKSTSGATVFRPKALSDRSTVCSSGRVRRAVTRWESAGGISESRRDVKMSARFATCQNVSAVGKAHVRTTTYLEILLRLQNLGQCLTGFNTKCVSQKFDLLDLVVALQVLNVRLNVLGGGELQALALNGKHLCSRHLCKLLWIFKK